MWASLSRAAALLVVLAWAGCSHRALAPSDAGLATGDLATGDLATMPAVADLAMPATDPARLCVLSTGNASLRYGAQALAYAWFGNQSGPGGEESCGRFGQVTVVLGTMPKPPERYKPTEPMAELTLVTPLQLGSQTVDVRTNIGDSANVSATLELTDFALDPIDQAVASISGRLQAADGSWDGSFAAARCSLFEFVCI
jgi:hypothetical protein